MPSYNKITLIGRLVRDPEKRYTSSGLAVTSFSIAVDRFAKDPQTGEKKTDFFRCTAWRQKAEFVADFIQKGRLVCVDGRVELNEYTKQDGTKGYSTDVVCDAVELLDSNRDTPGEAAPSGGEGRGGGYESRDGGDSRGGRGRGSQRDDDNGYEADDEPAPAPRRAAPAAPRGESRDSRDETPRGGQGGGRPAPQPARRPAPQPAYPADDDFDDSDPFADE